MIEARTMTKTAKRVMLALPAALAALFASAAVRAEDKIEFLQTVPADRPNPFYVSNAPPLKTSPLVRLPYDAIKTRGWLAKQLDLQRNGMTGKLAEVSKWLDYGHNGWVDPNLQGGWEELPYWLKGYGDLAYLSNDPAMIATSKKWIDAMLATQETDGWFGPKSLKTSIDKKNPDLWPHMLVLNVMQSWHEFSGDERVIPFMTKYFQWQRECPDETFMKGYWPVMRVSDNVESIHWLYNRTKEPWLLDVATKVYKAGANWENPDKIPNWHGVNQGESFRAATVYGEQSNDPKQLGAAEKIWTRIHQMYGDYPGGGWGADENCRPGFSDPRQGFETCAIVESMHSFEMLTKITADARWSERNERMAFNVFPAAMTADQKGLRYLTAANMANADRRNKSPGIQNRGTMLSYSPYQVYRCCQHNHAMGWPYYAEHAWLATADGGLLADLYTPSTVTAKVGADVQSGKTVTIEETTDYPWKDTITFKISGAGGATFPLYFRTPSWTTGDVTVAVKTGPVENGMTASSINGYAGKAGYARVTRAWKDGDTVTLTLPMKVAVRRWYKNSAGVSRGPIDFSLKIGEDYKPYGKQNWAEYDLMATTPWNFGLVLSRPDASAGFDVQTHLVTDEPFTQDTAPVTITTKAKPIDGWTLDKNGLTGPIAESPVKSDAPEQTVTLIPAGAARLRITAFPVIGTGPDAKPWPAAAYTASASHVNRTDTVEAVADGIEPKSSNDRTVPRMTWWDHRGTTETLDATFDKPRDVARVRVYWFDDTGDGRCRVPASWRLLYKDGDAWKPVTAASEAGTAKDTYNTLDFVPVKTTALRIEAKLQPEFSAGVLEWKFD